MTVALTSTLGTFVAGLAYEAIPQSAVGVIRTGFTEAMADAAVRERLGTLGNTVMTMTPAEFSTFVREEVAVSARLFKAAGIKPQ